MAEKSTTPEIVPISLKDALKNQGDKYKKQAKTHLNMARGTFLATALASFTASYLEPYASIPIVGAGFVIARNELSSYRQSADKSNLFSNAIKLLEGDSSKETTTNNLTSIQMQLRDVAEDLTLPKEEKLLKIAALHSKRAPLIKGVIGGDYLMKLNQQSTEFRKWFFQETERPPYPNIKDPDVPEPVNGLRGVWTQIQSAECGYAKAIATGDTKEAENQLLLFQAQSLNPDAVPDPRLISYAKSTVQIK